jgi:hypothetical protein
MVDRGAAVVMQVALGSIVMACSGEEDHTETEDSVRQALATRSASP